MSADATQRPIDLSIQINDLLVDVTVALRQDATGGDLFGLVERRLRCKPQQLVVTRTDEVVHFDTKLIDVDLLRGDVLTGSGSSNRNAAQNVVRLLSVGGDSPTAVELQTNTPIGRTTSWVLEDHGVSREHVMFHVDASGTTIEDLKSSNGTWVNGVRIERPKRLSAGDKIEIGPRIFEFVSGPETRRELQEGHLVHHNGSLEFTRPPRERNTPPQTAFKFPDPPDKPRKRKFPYAAALLPVVFGAVLVYVLGNWMFGLFMAMGPVMVLFNFVEDKKTGRTDYAQDSLDYRTMLASMQTEIADSHAQSVAARRARVPQNNELLSWGRAVAVQVWSRRPSDDDFFRLAPAEADQPTHVEVELPDRGSDELTQEATAIRDQVVIDRNCPVEIMADGAIIGIAGSPSDRAGIARSLIAQACVLQSPRDLLVAVIAPTTHDAWEWTKWLPHVDPGQSGDSRFLGLCDDSAQHVFEGLVQVLERRKEHSEKGQLGDGAAAKLPHIVTIIEPPAQINAREVQTFIEEGRRFGFTTIYLAPERSQLPGDTTVVIEPAPGASTADISLTESGHRFNDAAARSLALPAAARLARDLAPLVDVTAGSGSGEIPRSIALPELIDPAELTAAAMASKWQDQSDHKLEGILGAGPDGPYRLDLKARGPHGLVAGTTGAGKSELLQSMVMGLIVDHSPKKLNFIFIDYKANQIFQDLARLPHTVGVVTNLDRRLVDRSLVSLEAELRRRQHMFLDHEVNDLKEMRDQHLDAAPPFLYIIVDEFAALKTDAPEFLDGLVDIAQRGRSMGVHMVLATQKPAGIVPDQIDGNINVRIALRVASSADSQEVIGTTAAAEVSDTLPGRTFIKIGGGSGSVSEFQAAYMGAQTLTATSAVANDMQRFNYDSQVSALLKSTQPDSEGGSDGDTLIDRANEAWEASGSPRLHLPWAPTLATDIELADLLAGIAPAARPLDIVLATADHPDQQRQLPWSVDLTSVGNLAVYGTTGSGKTTLLRTMAASLSARSQPGTVAVYGLDFGSGLSSLLPLPFVGDIVPGQSLERLELALGLIENEIADRRTLMGNHTADSWHSLMATVGPSCPPFWVVMIDGFGSFWAAIEELGTGNAVSDKFVRTFAEGRSVGVHFVVTADQRSAIPHQFLGSIGQRLIQRLAAADEYQSLDVSDAPSASEMPPGRTIVVEGPDVQVAVATHSGDGTAVGQKAALDRLAQRLVDHGVSRTGRRFETVGDVVEPDQIPTASSLETTPVGLTLTMQPAIIDFHRQPGLLVVGGQGSGRSTALGAIARQIRPFVERMSLIAGKNLSPLIGSSLFDDECVRDATEFMQDFAEMVADRASSRPDTWIALVIDDGEVFFETAVADQLDKIAFALRDAQVVLVIATSTFQTARAYDSWIRSMRDNGHAIALQPDPDREGDLFDVRFPQNTATLFPPGRGYFLNRGQLDTIHLLSKWSDLQ